MPTPHMGESESDFMSRCIPMVQDDGTADSQDQAVAVCSSMWDQHMGGKAVPSANRAYAVLNIKSIDEETGVLEGIATTPEPDRMQDIVEPLGMKFSLPMPLLYQHKTDQPIGHVTSAKVDKKGIAVKAQLAPKGIAPFIDQARALIKAGLVRGFSIGFRPIEYAFIEATGGIHFLKSEWFELSVVTIPAQAQATITAIKSADASSLALLGNSRQSMATRPTATLAAAAASSGKKAMLNSERITQFENKRAANIGRMEEMMKTADTEGRTLVDAETQEYDRLDTEVKSIDTHLVRLRGLEDTLKAKAVAVTPTTTVTDTHGMPPRAAVQVTSLVPKGIGFARAMIALAVCKGNRIHAAEEAKKQWPDMGTELEAVIKTEQLPGTTTGTTWAAPLIQSSARLVGEFIEMLRPATIIGRIPGLRRVPFNVTVPVQSAGGTYGWVGENVMKPVSGLSLTTATLAYTKIAGIIPYTKEAMRFSDPSIETVIRNDMIAGVARYQDTQFVDPTVHISAGVHPGSITDQIIQVAASGTTATHFRNDFKNILGKFITNNQSPQNAVILMSATTAMNLASLMTSLGQQEFPTISMQGGTYMGIPIIVSENVGARVILVNPSDILLAEDPGVTIDVSEEASVVMTTTPESSPAASQLVSFWQTNLIGLRVEQFITWKRARTSSVEYIATVSYTG